MKTIEDIKAAFGNSSDLIVREFFINDITITLVQSEVLASSEFINQFILKKLTTLSFHQQNVEEILFNFLPDNTMSVLTSISEMYDYICKGFALLVYEENKAIAIEAKANLDRGIPIADNETSIRGSKDGFNENFNTNVGLIRRRIRSENCHLDSLYLGKETRTKTGIMYIKGITEEKNIQKVKKTLEKINIDGILDSGYVKAYLEDKDNFFFPSILSTERPDKAAQALLEGKIVIVVDNSPYVLITPTFFIDYLHTTDDYYQRSFNISFIRLIRFLAFLTAIFVPAIYIACTTHNKDAIPLNLLLDFSAQRQSVPFSALIEALFMSMMMFLAMFFGIFGIYAGMMIVLASLTTTKTLSLPYLAPFSPFIKNEIGDSIIKTKNKKVRKRNPLLTKNIIRGKDI